jgi:hypothetical protein
MIRAATNGDLTRLYELVMAVHARSIFKERGIEPSPELTRRLLFDGVRRHGGQHVGSTLLNVVEFRGTLEGFMLSLLQPIYSLGIELEAQDVLLFTTDKAPKIAPSLLVDAYLQWAGPNPRVRDIYLSWTDVAGVDGGKLSALYKRKGFQRCGEIWKRGVR